jgi:hypothetical protein
VDQRREAVVEELLQQIGFSRIHQGVRFGSGLHVSLFSADLFTAGPGEDSSLIIFHCSLFIVHWHAKCRLAFSLSMAQ